MISTELTFALLFKSYIAPALTPALVILGWFFVSRDNDRRETRKEIRALVNDVARRVEEIRSDANRYFCDVDNASQTGEAQRLEVKLKFDLDRLESILQILAKLEPSFSRATSQFNEFNSSITWQHKFESRTNTATLAPASPEVLRVSLGCSNLLAELESVFIDTQVHKSNLQDLC